MSRRSQYLCLVAFAWICIVLGASPTLAEKPPVQFNREIRPILAEKCLVCHGPDKDHRQADLRLDLEQDAKADRNGTPAIVPGKPQQSEIYRRIISTDDDEKMPPAKAGKSLAGEEIELIRRWINEGAKYQRHWSFEPIELPAIPKVKNAAWPRGEIDRFILDRLETAGLKPAPDAERRVLIRRVYFDLVGLPPTPEEVQAFVENNSRHALERVVDHLLTSPQFGEYWARHWLDLVRYAETYGYEHDWPIPLAWRYRDYVIRALNADVPYDAFLREHIAGDLLPNPRIDPTEKFNESIIGSGFWYLHGQMSQPVDVLQHEADRFDNQIDTFSRAFMGLTIACARCHDHKFDPVSTKDYYGLVSFLSSSRRQEAYLDPGGEIAAIVDQLAAVRREADAALAEQSSSKGPPLSQDIPNSILFEDFNGDKYNDWILKGQAFGDAPTRSRQWDRVTGGAVQVRPGLAHSGMLAGRLRGTLQSREFMITHSQVWLRVSGKGTIRVVINGYMMQRYKDQLFQGTEIKVDVPLGTFKWLALDRDVKLYLGHAAYLEIEDNSDSCIAVDEIRFANGLPPANEKEKASGPSGVAERDTRFLSLAKRMDELEKQLRPPLQVLAMADGNVVEARVNLRGNVRKKGELGPRRLPVAIYGGVQPPAPRHGSGRLELAQRMLQESDPLVARVRVNWVWHHLFGRGIVPTVDNFGVLGERPTHPMLLDYLAQRFRTPADSSSSEARGLGWSMKQLIREIVLSRTYQMSSKPTDPAAEQADPTNALLHRMRIRRLEGEAVRDAMLAVSGRLDSTPFGPPVPVHLTPFMQGLSRPEKSGPLDGNGRRSIYLEVRRNFMSPMFLAFDTPLPSTCMARRSVSNVPAQALILMNDPFVSQQAEIWADRVMKQTVDRRARIERMYLAAFSRPPAPRETELAERFLREQATALGVAPENAINHRPLWADFAHALLGVKEFIFVR